MSSQKSRENSILLFVSSELASSIASPIGEGSAVGRAGRLTQCKVEVLTISRKVLEQAVHWERFTALNVLNILAEVQLITARTFNALRSKSKFQLVPYCEIKPE